MIGYWKHEDNDNFLFLTAEFFRPELLCYFGGQHIPACSSIITTSVHVSCLFAACFIAMTNVFTETRARRIVTNTVLVTRKASCMGLFPNLFSSRQVINSKLHSGCKFSSAFDARGS